MCACVCMWERERENHFAPTGIEKLQPEACCTGMEWVTEKAERQDDTRAHCTVTSASLSELGQKDAITVIWQEKIASFVHYCCFCVWACMCVSTLKTKGSGSTMRHIPLTHTHTQIHVDRQTHTPPLTISVWLQPTLLSLNCCHSLMLFTFHTFMKMKEEEGRSVRKERGWF